ncbi:MAG: tyrosine-type recombinase/integrase [Paracoccaceae bacterium]
MRLVLRYVEKTRAGGWQYRRRVPKDLSAVFPKREFKRKLGDTEREALNSYPAFHAQVEREIADARRSVETNAAAERGELSDLQLHRLAYQRAVEMGMLNTDWAGRDHLAEAIINQYTRDVKTGYPINPTKLDAFTLRLLYSAGQAKPPQATLRDAMAFYLAEREQTEAPEMKDRFKQQVERVVGLVVEALDKDPVLENLTRDDARSVRDFMLERRKTNGNPISPSSVARDLNTLNAVINHAAQEMPLPATFKNPFSGLKIRGAKGRRDVGEERHPLPDDVLQKARERITTRCSAELALVWRLLEGTGCRLAEVTGLRAEDIDVSGEFPSLRVTWHEQRRLKTAASHRYVPLVGDALAAAKEALTTTRQGNLVFPSYCRPRGSDAASAALMNHLRSVSTNPKHVVHSLRHNMKDRLMLAEVSSMDQNLILGHELGGVGDRVYGGTPAKLRVTTRAMLRAFRLPDPQKAETHDEPTESAAEAI